MSTAPVTSAKRLHAAEVRQGEARRLGEVSPVENEREIDYGLGFDMGYRDGLSRATKEAEARSEEARQQWIAEASERVEDELAALRAARDALASAASAWRTRTEEEDAWASAIVVEAVHAVVLSYLGRRGVDASVIAELCAQTLRDMPERELVVRVSARDVEAVSNEVGHLAEVRADERLAAGECEVESPRGRLVTGIAARMDILRDELLHRLTLREGQGTAA